MSLEKSCKKCEKIFEDGDVLIKYEKNLYHHSVADFINSGLQKIFSCSLAYMDQGKVGIFHKDKFYDLEKNEDKLHGINGEFVQKRDENENIYGHKLQGNLSFLDNFEAD